LGSPFPPIWLFPAAPPRFVTIQPLVFFGGSTFHHGFRSPFWDMPVPFSLQACLFPPSFCRPFLCHFALSSETCFSIAFPDPPPFCVPLTFLVSSYFSCTTGGLFFSRIPPLGSATVFLPDVQPRYSESFSLPHCTVGLLVSLLCPCFRGVTLFSTALASSPTLSNAPFLAFLAFVVTRPDPLSWSRGTVTLPPPPPRSRSLFCPPPAHRLRSCLLQPSYKITPIFRATGPVCTPPLMIFFFFFFFFFFVFLLVGFFLDAFLFRRRWLWVPSVLFPPPVYLFFVACSLFMPSRSFFCLLQIFDILSFFDLKSEYLAP